MTTAPFSGSLQSKKKAELREIAVALRISDAGTREDVQLRIRKHLDENHILLEDDPVFSGLFVKRRKNVQHFIHVSPAVSPDSVSVEPISDRKRLTTPPSVRSTRRNAIPEATPVPEAREVSMMLKVPPTSPPEDEIPSGPAVTPHKERSVLFTSTPRSILRHIPRRSLDLADTTFKTLQTGAEQHARVYLQEVRTTLSNSLNISLITALFELLYLLYQVIPWTFKVIHLPRGLGTATWTWQVGIPYPPLATFQSSVFWSVLLHWSIPTLIIPALFGSLISFHPASSTRARVLRLLPLDPLTVSIFRLAAQYAYPYKALDATIEGIDVIGSQWRTLNAAVGVAFAFAEANFVAPSAFAESRVRLRGGTPRRTMALEE